MKKAVVALSGGMDSTTVLAKLLETFDEVSCVSFTYGSKHNHYENESAERIAYYYDTPFRKIDFTVPFSLFNSHLLKSGGDIPEGHYTDENMSLTVVPGRNIIFLSYLAGYAWSINASVIGIGIHQGDHAIYADCRKEFYKAIDTAIYLGTDNKIQIEAPFIDTDKQGILEWGIAHNVPYHLTRTCYKDQATACGKCGSCVERLEAFERVKEIDPLRYVVR